MRAKPTKPDRSPFSKYERPEWWHKFEQQAIDKRAKGKDGVSSFNAVLGWHYGTSPRSREEELFFGKTKSIGDFICQEHPFLAMIPKHDGAF